MTILQQPDPLSLSGNIKEFRIGTTDIISFRLLQGDEEIVARSYEPGADGVVIINIQDIIHARLSFLFNNTSMVYEQKTIVSTFKALLSGTEVEFTAIRCGVDMLADTPANFLLQNFLTWQPNVKPVTYYSPEFLTYYAVQECRVKLHAYFTDESATIVSQSDLVLADLTKGKAYTIPLQYASVVGKLGDKMPAYYDVWVEGAEGIRLSYVQRYYASDMKSETEQWVLFENSLGGIDTFRAYGSTAFTGEHTHNIAEIDDMSLEYRVDTARKFQKDTGYLNKKERTWLLDFFPSLKKYLYTGAYIRSIIVVESNVTYTDKELPSNYTFTYKFADAKPFLNLQRSDTPTDALEIVVPEVGSFTVPPRLIEFPRLPLSEGALFPVQDPFSENWNVTTAGSLGDFITERIAKDYGGGGGVGHQHNNIDLLQLMSYAAEYLLVSGKKIKAGYADKAGVAHDLDKDGPIYERFIRKDKEDRTDSLLKLLGGTITDNIESQEFLSGVLGTGFLIKRDSVTGKSYAEIDEIYVRLKAVFDSLEIRHSTHVGGQQILSPAGMTCIRVEEYDAYYRCFMKADDGSKAIQNLFAENDQAQCHDINVKEGIYENVSNQYYWRLVIGIGDDYIDLSKDDCDKGSTVPAAGDNICQLGNRIHKERQNAIIISSYGPDSPSFKQYAGIDSYSLEGREVTVLSPSGNELSGKLHIQPGSTGWQSLDGLPEGIKEAADSAISGIELGKNNLLRNSGFTGDYQTANLNSDTSLDVTSELYSPSLKYWDVVNAVAQESEISMSGKEVVIKSGSMTQALFYRIIPGESYIFSFYGKGTSVTFSCGGYAETIPLTDEYERYICRFKTLSAGSILSIHSATGSFCELQLERGTVPSSWGASMMDNTSELAHYQELEYLTSAIKEGSVDVLGGLILANMLQLGNYKDGKMQKVTAGISGIYNNDDDVFAFGGGTLEQAISTVAKYKDNPSYQPTDEELNSIAKIVFTHGGRTILNDVVLRGYIYALGGVFSGKVSIADGKILLNEDGTGHLADGSIYWDKYGYLYQKSRPRIVWREIQQEMEAEGMDMNEKAPYNIDLRKGTYINTLCYHSDVRYINLPSPADSPGAILDIKSSVGSRSSGAFLIRCSSAKMQRYENKSMVIYDAVYMPLNTQGVIEAMAGPDNSYWLIDENFIKGD